MQFNAYPEDSDLEVVQVERMPSAEYVEAGDEWESLFRVDVKDIDCLIAALQKAKTITALAKLVASGQVFCIDVTNQVYKVKE